MVSTNKPTVRDLCPQCCHYSIRIEVGEMGICPGCGFKWWPQVPYAIDIIFNRKCQPFADIIYKKIWNAVYIKRDLGKLDKDRGIDCHLTLESGLTIDIQEKFRRPQYIKFWQFTMEYKNNPATNEEGEFFHLAANYYFYGYSKYPDGGDFDYWWIIDLNKFKEHYNRGLLKESRPGANNKRSRATFKCFEFKNIEHLIFARSF